MAQVLIAHPTLFSFGHCVARILTRIKLSSTMSPKKWLSNPQPLSRNHRNETITGSAARNEQLVIFPVGKNIKRALSQGEPFEHHAEQCQVKPVDNSRLSDQPRLLLRKTDLGSDGSPCKSKSLSERPIGRYMPA
jgi:hypothetical protein